MYEIYFGISASEMNYEGLNIYACYIFPTTLWITINMHNIWGHKELVNTVGL